MSQRHPRLIAGLYQTGQMLTSDPFLTSYSAYNRNSSDVVGLLVIELPPTLDPLATQQLLAPLARRRQAQSPHVIRIHDWGMFEHYAYIATDPPRGITLRQLADTENIDLARSLNLSIQVARGLAVLHNLGIADLDLRPQLITVDTIGIEDRAQLDDVGLRMLFHQLGYTQGQNLHDIGQLDPRYMAPEHIFYHTSGTASDIYQLGILLFELITGRPPFVGRTPAETGIMQGNSPVPRMLQFKHDTPPELQTIVERALAKDPRQRYPHVAELLAALEAIPQKRLQRPSGKWQATLAQTVTPSEGLPPAPQHSSPTHEIGHLPNALPIEAIETVIVDKQALREAESSRITPLNEGEPVYAYLDYEQEGTATQRVPIKEKYVIVGRVDPKHHITPEIDLTALDPQATVSRQHARIRFENTFFYIEDLKSRNKTRLGELFLAPLKPELLQHGDIIFFGSLKMVFRIPGQHEQPIPKNLA